MASAIQLYNILGYTGELQKCIARSVDHLATMYEHKYTSVKTTGLIIEEGHK